MTKPPVDIAVCVCPS